MEKLSLDAKIALLSKMMDDYLYYSKSGNCPNTQSFSISYPQESRSIVRHARLAALETYSTPIVKQAFDTRRINQVTDRNPRRNLQFYHRADPFIDEDDNKILSKFAKLLEVTGIIKEEYGNEPEWFDSYARQLHEGLERTLKVNNGDLEVFKPQLKYLEQLIYARYRMTLEDLEKYGSDEIKKVVLGKDENLIKRGNYAKKPMVIKDGNSTTQESIVNAIFGAPVRKEGEKTVSRTITITIRDNVEE